MKFRPKPQRNELGGFKVGDEVRAKFAGGPEKPGKISAVNLTGEFRIRFGRELWGPMYIGEFEKI